MIFTPYTKYKIRNTRYNSGFTLVELLVVIAIISVLASIVFASLNSTRAKARDSRRLRDFQEFEKALELFYDTYSVYPCGDSNSSDVPGGTSDSSFSFPFLDGKESTPPSQCLGNPTFGIFTAKVYSLQFPKDPINSSPAYGYGYFVPVDRQSYLLLTRLEQNSQNMQADGGLCDNFYEKGPGTGQILIPSAFGGIPCN